MSSACRVPLRPRHTKLWPQPPRSLDAAKNGDAADTRTRAPAGRGVRSDADLEVHPPHATSRGHWRSGLLRTLGHHGFRCDEQTGNGGCILQRAAHDLGRIDHALADEIAIGTRLRVVAVGV